MLHLISCKWKVKASAFFFLGVLIWELNVANFEAGLGKGEGKWLDM